MFTNQNHFITSDKCHIFLLISEFYWITMYTLLFNFLIQYIYVCIYLFMNINILYMFVQAEGYYYSLCCLFTYFWIYLKIKLLHNCCIYICVGISEEFLLVCVWQREREKRQHSCTCAHTHTHTYRNIEVTKK